MSLLVATESLVAAWAAEEKPPFELLKSWAYTVYLFGTEEDKAAILELCCAYPSSFEHRFLIPLLEQWANLDAAERLYNAHFQSDRLKNEDYPEWLSLLAELGYEKLKPALIHYAFAAEAGHYLRKEAVFGLLKMDCSELQTTIVEQIQACYGRGLFPEFIPMLAAKVENPAIKTQIISDLYELENTTASTDCNGGIILAFSLCGQEGADFFQKILWDERWECTGSGTGSAHCSYSAMQNLGWTFRDLYQQMQNLPSQRQKYAIRVWLDLLEIGLRSDYQSPKEGFLRIFSELFYFQTEPYKQLHGWARAANLEESFYHCADLLKNKLQMEFLAQNIRSTPTK